MDAEIISQLFLATFLGAAIGLEREKKGKEAGLQTYSLVALGACLFSIIAILLTGSGVIPSPSEIFLAIGLGMGFIGAGTIFRKEDKVEGLTTAAGLWVTAAIGLAVGTQLYYLAVLTTFLVLFIFVGLGFLEDRIFKQNLKE